MDYATASRSEGVAYTPRRLSEKNAKIGTLPRHHGASQELGQIVVWKKEASPSGSRLLRPETHPAAVRREYQVYLDTAITKR